MKITQSTEHFIKGGLFRCHRPRLGERACGCMSSPLLLAEPHRETLSWSAKNIDASIRLSNQPLAPLRRRATSPCLAVHLALLSRSLLEPGSSTFIRTGFAGVAHSADSRPTREYTFRHRPSLPDAYKCGRHP